MKVIPYWGSKIVNQVGLHTNSLEKWCFSTKNESPFKKIVSLKDLFFEARGILARKRKGYKIRVAIQISAIRGCHECHARSHNDTNIRNANIGDSYSITNKINLIVVPALPQLHSNLHSLTDLSYIINEINEG